jgi:hypothetical protein
VLNIRHVFLTFVLNDKAGRKQLMSTSVIRKW